MPRFVTLVFRLRLPLLLLLGTFVIVAILYLSGNVARDLRLLNSASSDNVQWSLSQTEVEFLEFELHLAKLPLNTPDALVTLRREYDIFFSRINTLKDASNYEALRAERYFSDSLQSVETFLDDTVGIIDAPDAELVARFSELQSKASEVGPAVRRLSNSGLSYFALLSDRRRTNVAVTLSQMAVGVTVLLLAMLFLALYLGYLNRQSNRRRIAAVEASHRMNIVTSTSLDAVIVADAAGKILDFNAAAEQIFGYQAGDAIGQDLGTLIVPDDHRPGHEAGMQRMRENGARHVIGMGRVQLEAKRRGGACFPIELAVQSAQTEEGEIFIAFLRDISSRIQAEQELVTARDRALAGEKAKTDFLATMSHEIRTPLNGLLGNLTLLHDTDLTAQQSRYIKNMDTSGKLLMSHISDVLDITKYDAGKLLLRPTAMNISTLLQDIVDNQSSAATARGTTLEWAWTSPPVDWIRADRERVQHILMNVIGNAVKFTHQGRITVHVAVSDREGGMPEIEFIVADTGIGIDPDLQSQIFDDFTTGDSSYDRNVGGTGLGLGIAQRFVKAFGGEIELESTKGVGSTFSIHFPIEPITAPGALVAHRKTAGHAPSRAILLVEDNKINRIVAREMITSAGHQVSEAHNGREAVEMAGVQAFDLIFMDISMPVMDGRGATRAIRAGQGASAQTPIVALTANAMAEEQEAFLSDGMNYVLTKPLSRDDLLHVIALHTDNAHGNSSVPQCPTGDVAASSLDELRQTLGVENLQSLIDQFDREFDALVTHLGNGSAVSLGDVAQTAHRIAGSAATLGAVELRSALLAVEKAAKAQDAGKVDSLVPDLCAIWGTTRPLLQTRNLGNPHS